MKPPLQSEARSHIDAMIAAALDAANPRRAVASAWDASKSAPPLEGFGLVAVGKAAAAMTQGVLLDIGAVPGRGVMIVPDHGEPETPIPHPSIRVVISDHPHPTPRSVVAAEAALETAAWCRASARPLVVLLSGGASSLMCLPEPGLSIDDLRGLTDAILRSGANIRQINSIRSWCDRVKGGGLASAAAPAPVYSFLLSDVIGDSLSAIGSGPTAPRDATAAQALALLDKLGLLKTCAPVAAHLRLLAAASPAEPDLAQSRPDVFHTIIGNNHTALRAAAERAIQLGFEVGEVRSCVEGEARDAAFSFIGAIRRARARSEGGPVAVLWGGETTVSIRTRSPTRAGSGKGRRGKSPQPDVGLGGRNQEAALAAAIAIDNDPAVVIGTFSTDGADGPTPAAGAIVDGRTAGDARRAGSDPEDALAAHDSHTFFKSRGGLIETGPTGTNVNDLWFGLAY